MADLSSRIAAARKKLNEETPKSGSLEDRISSARAALGTTAPAAEPPQMTTARDLSPSLKVGAGGQLRSPGGMPLLNETKLPAVRTGGESFAGERTYGGGGRISGAYDTVSGQEDFSSVLEEMKTPRFEAGDLIPDVLKGDAGARSVVKNIQRGTLDSLQDQYKYLTQEQKDVLLYYGGRGEWDKATEYLDRIREGLNAKAAAAQKEKIESAARENPVVASLASPAASWAGGVYGAADLAFQSARRAITGQPVDYNSEGQRVSMLTEQLRGPVSQMIEEKAPQTVAGINVASLAYNAVMSGLDSFGLGAIAKGAKTAGLILSAGAAASGARDAAGRGGSDNEALAVGLAAGVFEALFESVSIGNFKALKEVPVETVRDFVANVAKSAGVNFSEEALTEAANLVTDTLVMGDASNWAAMVKEQGTRGAALNVITQIGAAGASGLLMGVGSGTAGSVSGALSGGTRGQTVSETDTAAGSKGTAVPGLVKDGTFRKANLSSRDSRTLDAVGKVAGVEVRFAPEVTVDGKKANAKYEGGVITIALDAQDPVRVAFTHEIVHRIREASPESYASLESFVRNGMRSSSMEILGDLYSEVYETGDVDVYTEELVADAFGAMLGDRAVLEQFVRDDRNAAQKMLDAVHDFIAAIRRALSGQNKTLSMDERRAFAELETDLTGMEQALTNALNALAGSENAAPTEGTAKASYAGVKSRTADLMALQEADIRAVQSVGRKSINNFTSEDIAKTEGLARKHWREMGTKSPFFRAWFGDWRAYDQTAVEVASLPGSNRNAQRNKDTGWDIQVSGKVFNESRHAGPKNRAALSYLNYINDIVEKAVLLDSQTLAEGKAKSANSLMMHSLYAVADVGSGPEVIKLYVEEMYDPNRAGTVKRAYQLQNIEYQQLESSGFAKIVSPINQAADIQTVADLCAAVKGRDPQFNPRPVSSVLLNEDGSPKKFYHGTGEKFYAFDPNERSPREGSYFFAENRMDAEAYGERVLEVYLQGGNLANYDNQPREFYQLRNKREQVEWLKERGYDGWYADMDSGGWGEVSVFYPEQIKSATGNVGTFDGTNPDIRYSRQISPEQWAETAQRIEAAALPGAEKTVELIEPPTVKSPEFTEPPMFKRGEPLPGGNVSESNTRGVQAAATAEVQQNAAPAADAQQNAAPAADAQQEPEDLAKVKDLWRRQKKAKTWLKDVEKRIELSEEVADRVKRLASGHLRPDEIPDSVATRPEIKEVYRAAADKAALDKELAAWNAARKQKLWDRADYFLQNAVDMKDKLAGVLYQRETLDRNIRDIQPDKKLADEMVAEYWDPVQKNEAAANDMRNAYRDRVRKLDISRKVAEGNTVSEAHAVQFVGEAEDNIRFLKNKRSAKATRDGKTAQEWAAELAKLWEENPNLSQEKIRGAVTEFHKIYDELFEQMNDVRVRNGYDPIEYRSGYFPHFQSAEEGSLLDKLAKGLGITPEVTTLPTTINGMTHAFKPGIRWFGNAQHRTGFDTTYDAVEGFDKYINSAADIIHHTDDIQRLRALASEIRYRTGDESIRNQIDEIRNNPALDEETRAEKIQELKDEGRYALGNFVVDLEEYTNNLANKRSRSDRDMEQSAGRRAYNVVNAINQRVAANMVAVNPGSWLTNFAALTQGGSAIKTKYMLQGMWDTLKSYKADDGMVDRSTFLTNRKGSDPLVKTWQQAVSSKLSEPMEYIDQFVAGSLVRARYLENLASGMNESAALDDADSFTGHAMAGRSKGSMPTLFNAKNPITKLFTQFRLEVNNQYSFLLKDLPRESKEKAGKVLAVMLLKFALGAFLFNEVYEKLVGRRPALDPIGILNDTVGDFTGYELPNLVDLGVGAVTGEMPSFQVEKTSAGEALGNLATNVAEELPFVGGLLGGGRLPISSALPNAGKIVEALDFTTDRDGKARAAALWEGVKNPVTYLAPPFGGGQVKKVAEGIRAVAKGGSYKKDSQGNDKLQYPVYSDSTAEGVGNFLKAVTFGKSSLETAQDWVEGGFKTWDAGYTKAYQTMREAGMGERDAYEILSAMRAGEKDQDKLGTLAGAKLDNETTQMLAGLVMGDELETKEGNKTAYAKLLDAEDELGLTAAEYLDYYVKYGGQAMGQDKVREAYDLGIGVEEYLDYYAGKKEYDLDKSGSYSTIELIDSIENSGMTGEARTGMYLLTFPEWRKTATEAGVGINTFIDYKLATSGLKGKDNVLNAINKMKVSKGTKDKLYLAAGYSESGLKSAPWN